MRDPRQADPPDRPQAAGAESAPCSGGGLSITTERRGRWWVLVVVGELDMATAPALDDHISRALSVDCPPRVALELSGLRFCDSSGINAFVRGWKRAGVLGGELVLVGPTQRVADYLLTTGVDGGASPSPPLYLSDSSDAHKRRRRP